LIRKDKDSQSTYRKFESLAYIFLHLKVYKNKCGIYFIDLGQELQELQRTLDQRQGNIMKQDYKTARIDTI